MIKVSGLKKYYRVLERKEGLIGSAKNLFSRNYKMIKAVDNISFSIEEGEVVGFLGPNGAGKSTTLKILIGILKSSEGICSINNLDPFLERKKYVKNIGVVMGQRSQLWWDLPVIESFKLLKEIYEISDIDYTKNMKLFEKLLNLNELYLKPVKNLSLGQRTLCDIAASFIHNPKIVFLDEPTIGLDISVKNKVRILIKELNRIKNSTIIITSHDIGDIESLATRIILINAGKILYDGSIDYFSELYQKFRIITFTRKSDMSFINQNEMILRFEEKFGSNMEGIQLVDFDLKGGNLMIDTSKINLSQVLRVLVDNLFISDIAIEHIKLEEVLRNFYEGNII